MYSFLDSIVTNASVLVISHPAIARNWKARLHSKNIHSIQVVNTFTVDSIKEEKFGTVILDSLYYMEPTVKRIEPFLKSADAIILIDYAPPLFPHHQSAHDRLRELVKAKQVIFHSGMPSNSLAGELPAFTL